MDSHRETGFLFDTVTPMSLSTAIINVMNDKGSLGSVATAARKNVEAKANWSKNQQKVRERIKQLIVIN